MYEGMGDLDWENTLDRVKPDIFFAAKGRSIMETQRGAEKHQICRSKTSSSSRIRCTKLNINQGESGEERKEETEASSTRRKKSLHFVTRSHNSSSSVLKIRNGSFHDNKDIKIQQNRNLHGKETHNGGSSGTSQ